MSEAKDPGESEDTVQQPPPMVIGDEENDRTRSDETGGKLDPGQDEISNRGSHPSTPKSEVDLEVGEGAELKTTSSKVIPRNKRRGLFARLVIGIPEIDDPVQYSRGIKNFIVFIIACAALAGPMG
jgi:hypothetical protein